MPSELSDLLERGAEQPSHEPDFTDLARRGRRRRYTQRTTQGLAVVAVVALTAGVILPQLRKPEVLFDTGPRQGVGTWQAVPPAPIGPREGAIVAGDDHRAVVFGGMVGDNLSEKLDGAVYDVRTRTWTHIPATRLASVDHLELLDNGRLLVMQSSPIMAGFFDYDSGTWEYTRGAPVPGRSLESVIWTGDQLMVWGGWNGMRELGDGAVWTQDRGWTQMADSPLAARNGFASAWTGDRLLIWGGGAGDAESGEEELVFSDGAAYDPANDRWTPLPAAPLEARQEPSALWTGEDWVVFGGGGAARPVKGGKEPVERRPKPTEHCDGGTCTSTVEGSITVESQSIDGEQFLDGARYDPATDRWSPVANPPKDMRVALWYGYEPLLVAGKDRYAEYDSATDTWDVRPVVDIGGEIAPWDGVVADGRVVLLNSAPAGSTRVVDRPRRLGGVVYDSDAKRWNTLTEADTPQREGAVVTAVGKHVFVWGGRSVTRDISQGYSSADGDPWHAHADGAILTLD